MTDVHKLEGADLAASRESSAPPPITAPTGSHLQILQVSPALVLDLPLRWLRLTPDGGLAIVRPGATHE